MLPPLLFCTLGYKTLGYLPLIISFLRSYSKRTIKAAKEKLNQDVFCKIMHFNYGTNAREEEKSGVTPPGKLSQAKFTYSMTSSAFIYTHSTLINCKKKQSSKQGTKKSYSQSGILSLSWMVGVLTESLRTLLNTTARKCSQEQQTLVHLWRSE